MNLGYNQRFYEIQDAQCVLAVHPLPTAVRLRFEGSLFGFTTPVLYTASAPNPIPVPLLCPLPWVGHSEAVVPGTKVAPAMENTGPQALQATCYLVLQGVVLDECLDRLKAEHEARHGDEWTPIFNDSSPAPNRTPDSGRRRGLQATTVADDDDITAHELPKLITTGELICVELDQLFSL